MSRPEYMFLPINLIPEHIILKVYNGLRGELPDTEVPEEEASYHVTCR